MSTRKALSGCLLALAFATAPAVSAENTGLGKPITEADVKNWDIAILPDGSNLPPGSGTPAQGAALYAQQCLGCHGEDGKGGLGGGPLARRAPLTHGIETPQTI